MGLGSPADTSWEMEQAGFGEAWLTGARQQPVGFEAQLGVPFWSPGGITFGMGLGSPGDTSWEMEKAAFGEARLTSAR